MKWPRLKRSDKSARRPRYGTGSATVFSYHTKRTASGESRRPREADGRPAQPVKRKRDYRALRYLPSWLAAIAIVASFVYISGVEADPQVEIINGTSASSRLARPIEEYRQTIRDRLNANLLNKSKLSIDSRQLEREITDAFPEVDSAVMALPVLRRRPLISLRLAEPVLVLSNSSGDYAVDRSGKVIAELSAGRTRLTGSELPEVEDQTGLEVTPGDIAMASSDVAFVREVYGQLHAKGLEVEYMRLPALPAELHVKVKSDDYYVKFNFFTSARVAVGGFLAARSEAGDKAGEYIDARIEERVYYR